MLIAAICNYKLHNVWCEILLLYAREACDIYELLEGDLGM